MSAYIVVGPTNRNPRERNVLLSAVDSVVTAGMSPSELGLRLPAGGAKLQTSSSS